MHQKKSYKNFRVYKVQLEQKSPFENKNKCCACKNKITDTYSIKFPYWNPFQKKPVYDIFHLSCCPTDYIHLLEDEKSKQKYHELTSSEIPTTEESDDDDIPLSTLKTKALLAPEVRKRKATTQLILNPMAETILTQTKKYYICPMYMNIDMNATLGDLKRIHTKIGYTKDATGGAKRLKDEAIAISWENLLNFKFKIEESYLIKIRETFPFEFKYITVDDPKIYERFIHILLEKYNFRNVYKQFSNKTQREHFAFTLEEFYLVMEKLKQFLIEKEDHTVHILKKFPDHFFLSRLDMNRM